MHSVIATDAFSEDGVRGVGATGVVSRISKGASVTTPMCSGVSGEQASVGKELTRSRFVKTAPKTAQSMSKRLPKRADDDRDG